MIDNDRPTDADKLIGRVTRDLLLLDMQKSNGPTVDLPPLDDPLWAFWRDFAHRAVMTYTSALGGHPHTYLSTSCLHGEHGYCKANTGAQGDKIPAVCKFCHAGCVCACHATGAVVAPQTTDPQESTP